MYLDFMSLFDLIYLFISERLKLSTTHLMNEHESDECSVGENSLRWFACVSLSPSLVKMVLLFTWSYWKTRYTLVWLGQDGRPFLIF